MPTPQHDPIHVLVYGEAGAGKSQFASTFPKPIYVAMWDGIGKDMPYRKRGQATQVFDDTEISGLQYREVWLVDDEGHAKSKRPIIRIDYFMDVNPKDPRAFERWQARLVDIEDFLIAGKFKTLVFDSTTSAELLARKLHQHRLNKTSKDPRQWFAGSTDLLEESLMGALPSLITTNVVVVSHISEDKDEVAGTFVRNPLAPGRLQKRLASRYGEFYRAYVSRDDDGERYWALQTTIDDRYNAATQIGAPDPCEPTYNALFAEEADE